MKMEEGLARFRYAVVTHQVRYSLQVRQMWVYPFRVSEGLGVTGQVVDWTYDRTL